MTTKSKTTPQEPEPAIAISSEQLKKLQDVIWSVAELADLSHTGEVRAPNSALRLISSAGMDLLEEITG